MMGSPFLIFYIVGLVLDMELQFLAKIGILMVLFLIFHFASNVLFDDRLSNVLPVAIYLATKFWMYLIWLLWITPVISPVTTIIFLSGSAILWYSYLKTWKGDPGVVQSSMEQKFRVNILFINLALPILFTHLLIYNVQWTVDYLSLNYRDFLFIFRLSLS
jgi:palmitoyltransferase ZDHHC13/17